MKERKISLNIIRNKREKKEKKKWEYASTKNEKEEICFDEFIIILIINYVKSHEIRMFATEPYDIISVDCYGKEVLYFLLNEILTETNNEK